MRCRRSTAVAYGLMALPATAALPAVLPKEAIAGSGHDRLERAIVREVNDVRANAGVRAVRASGALARAASRHSSTQLRRNSLSHSGLGQRVRRYTNARTVGETIAWTQGRARASRVVQMWMSSPSHRAQLLSSSYRRIGVGRRTGRLGGSRGTMITANLASG